MILPDTFYIRNEVTLIARELLGKYLVTNFNNQLTSGMITETEAYAGITDKASHAYGGRRTQRTEVMFRRGGVAYVYLCYGIHHLFNVVTNLENIPHAVLIRGIEPIDGISIMMERRKMQSLKTGITAGPGALSAALGIHYSDTGTKLLGSEIWIEDRNTMISNENIMACARIGVDYAAEDALLPYRFFIKGNRYVSKAKNNIS